MAQVAPAAAAAMRPSGNGKNASLPTALPSRESPASFAFQIAIRDASTKRTLYVGSSNGKLYDTLTRHFQTWSRQKKFWEKAYSSGKAHEAFATAERKLSTASR